eukprot:gene17070-biopygen20339
MAPQTRASTARRTTPAGQESDSSGVRLAGQDPMAARGLRRPVAVFPLLQRLQADPFALRHTPSWSWGNKRQRALVRRAAGAGCALA